MPDPIRIGLTGADGLIGRHLRCFLKGVPGVSVFTARRATFSEPGALRAFTSSCDAIVHLAGMNRGDEAEIEAVNVRLADDLVRALEESSVRPHILFASSAHITLDTPYARSKRTAAARLSEWAARSGGRYSTLIMPHIFGEGGRPFYNSAVSTFCHQLARGELPKIIQDRPLELLHAQRLAEHIYEIIEARRTGDITFSGDPMTVTKLLATVTRMSEEYAAGMLPDLRANIQLDLFNTLRSYLFPDHYPVSLQIRADARGRLFEAVKSGNGGQCFLSTTHPDITRGNHYHRRKVERFLVLNGDALIRIKHVLGGPITEFRVAGDTPAFIDIPTLHTHNISNIGTADLLTLFWAHEVFDPAAPDTFAEPVLEDS